MPKATDRTFCDKLVQLWRGKSAQFEAHRFDQGFTLQHYAGKVEYGVEGWLEKNKDPLNENLVNLLSRSGSPFLVSLFEETLETTGANKFVKKGLFRTVAQRHRESLQLLMQTLHATQPHFVRCIIPNEQKQPDQLMAPLVLDQLRCNGVLEGIRICRQGYPHRVPFADFVRLYSILATGPLPTESRDACRELARQLELVDQMALGHTKVFLRTGHLGRLDVARDQRLDALLTSLQAHCRGHLQRRATQRSQRQVNSTALLVRNAKAMLELKQWPWWRLYSRIIPLTDLFRNQQRVQEAAEELSRIQRDRDQQLANLRATLEKERERVSELEAEKREGDRARIALESTIKQVEIRLEETLEVQRSLEREALRQREQLVFEQGEAQANLEAERKRAKEQLDAAQLETHVARDEIRQRESQLQAIQLEREDLQSQLASLQLKLSELQSQLEQAKRQIAELQAKLTGAEESRADLQARLESTISEGERTKLELAEARQKIKQEAHRWEQEKKAAAEDVEQERRRWERECMQIQGELELERQQVQGLRESLQLLEQQRPSSLVSAGNHEAERQLDQQKRERERLESLVNELQARLEEAGLREAEVEGWLEEAREQSRLVKRQLGDFEDNLLAMERQRRLAEQRGESLGDQLRLTQQELRQAQEQLAILAQQRQETEGLLAAEREKNRLQADRMAGQERANRLREAQAEETKAALQEALQQRKNLESECANLRGQLEDLRLLSPRSHHLNNHPSSSLSSLIEQVEAEVEQRQGLIRENGRLTRQLNLLQGQLEEALQARLQSDESLGRQEGRLRKALSRIEELEQLVQEGEARRRRAERQQEEERERSEHLMKEVGRLKLVLKVNNSQ